MEHYAQIRFTVKYYICYCIKIHLQLVSNEKLKLIVNNNVILFIIGIRTHELNEWVKFDLFTKIELSSKCIWMKRE